MMRARGSALLGIQLMATILALVTAVPAFPPASYDQISKSKKLVYPHGPINGPNAQGLVSPTPMYSLPSTSKITSGGQPTDIHPFHDLTQQATSYGPLGNGLSLFAGSDSKQRQQGEQFASGVSHSMPPKLDKDGFPDWLLTVYKLAECPPRLRREELVFDWPTMDVPSQPRGMRGHLESLATPGGEPKQTSLLPVRIPEPFPPTSWFTNDHPVPSSLDEDQFVPNSFPQVDEVKALNSPPASNAIKSTPNPSSDYQASTLVGKIQKRPDHLQPDSLSAPSKKQRVIITPQALLRPGLPLHSKPAIGTKTPPKIEHLDPPSLGLDLRLSNLPRSSDARTFELVDKQIKEFSKSIDDIQNSLGLLQRAIKTDIIKKKEVALFELPPDHQIKTKMYIIRLLPTVSKPYSRFKSNKHLERQWNILLHWLLLVQQAFLHQLNQPSKFQQKAKSEMLQWVRIEFFTPTSNSLPVVGIIDEKIVPDIEDNKISFGQVQDLILLFIGSPRGGIGYQTASHLVGIWYKTFYKESINGKGWDDHFQEDKDFWSFIVEATKVWIPKMTLPRWKPDKVFKSSGPKKIELFNEKGENLLNGINRKG